MTACPQIENVLFRVPRILFEQSETFSDMFQIPPPQGTTVEGSDDDHPLVLEGYLVHEFRALLQVLFPLYVVRPSALRICLTCITQETQCAR
jgi:hypothetical protein